jgi:hypothetical protein
VTETTDSGWGSDFHRNSTDASSSSSMDTCKLHFRTKHHPSITRLRVAPLLLPLPPLMPADDG